MLREIPIFHACRSLGIKTRRGRVPILSLVEQGQDGELALDHRRWLSQIQNQHKPYSFREIPMNVTVDQIAQVCHETNRAFCRSIGDNKQLPWGQAEPWQRDSAIKGVVFKLENPEATPEQQHENWCKDKVKDGWAFGPKKDPVAKTHPCLLPYDGLPVEQRVKDELFCSVVNAMKKLLPL